MPLLHLLFFYCTYSHLVFPFDLNSRYAINDDIGQVCDKQSVLYLRMEKGKMRGRKDDNSKKNKENTAGLTLT